jgi:hypothetical protein
VALRFQFRLAAAACLGLAGAAGAADAPKSLPMSAMAGASDQQLADAIATRLAQAPGLAGYQVDVSCVNGTVELTGSVASAQQQSEVSKLVASIKGVKRLDNKLAIRTDIKSVQAIEVVPGPGAGMPPGGMPAMPGAGYGHGPMGGPGPMGGGYGPGPMPGGFGPGGPGGYGPGGPGGGYGSDPAPVQMPPTAGLYDGTPPKMPPYAWPTYAPYNNYSRVGYPTEYPANAFPYIGPFYPFPKVPLGFRAIKLEWEDGHWYYGRTATTRDWWKVRYW